MGKELEGWRWSKPDGENPHFRTQAAKLSLLGGWGAPRKGVQGTGLEAPRVCSELLSLCDVRKSLRAEGGRGTLQ